MKKYQWPWQEIELNSKEMYHLKIGELNVWMRNPDQEFYLAYEYQKVENTFPEASSEVSEKAVWNRWTIGSAFSRVKIEPLMPDLPLVIKPESNIHLKPQASCRIFVRVPLWVRISLPEISMEDKRNIIELPSVVLSKTWFGEYTEGQLCYWISSSARSEYSPDPARPYLAIISILLTNKSPEELSAEKILIESRRLSLFAKEHQLWTNEYRMNFRGIANLSQVDISKRPPKFISGATLISSARESAKSIFNLKSFSVLQEFKGLGIQLS